MKHLFKFLCITALFGCTLLAVWSCNGDYDDSEIKGRLDKVEDRVAKLEEWCTAVNNEIASLKSLITALENNDYVTGVEPLENGYRITFSKSESIILRNGKDGKDGNTPVISAAKYTDGLYYWTLLSQDGSMNWLTDTDGNMIRATGKDGKDGTDGKDGADGDDGKDGTDGKDGADGNNAHTPEIKTGAELGNSYISDAVYLSVDGGKTWTKISGDKGEQGEQGETGATGLQGDAIFAKNGIQIHSDYVTFTLTDGSIIELPLKESSIGFTSYDTFGIEYNETATEIELKVPSSLKQSDFAAIKAELTNTAGTSTDIQTRAAASIWNVKVTQPAFNGDGSLKEQPKATITVPDDAVGGETALLKVTLVNANGKESSSTRVVSYLPAVIRMTLEGSLIAKGQSRTLTPVFFPADAVKPSLIWESSNTDIATIDANGVITGIDVGETIVTVTSRDNDNIKATCTVQVISKDIKEWLKGTWEAQDTKNGSDDGGPYEVTISDGQASGELLLNNLFDVTASPLKVTIDSQTSQVSIPIKQKMFTHNTLGDVFIYHVNGPVLINKPVPCTIVKDNELHIGSYGVLNDGYSGWFPYITKLTRKQP